MAKVKGRATYHCLLVMQILDVTKANRSMGSYRKLAEAQYFH
jgi:hypothetical protein